MYLSESTHCLHLSMEYLHMSYTIKNNFLIVHSYYLLITCEYSQS
uniref:Uncharacterized protein n=1 Tax=Dulem virus 42 TaxID=3145760 RepID=A0AAU8B7V4_9CAUD